MRPVIDRLPRCARKKRGSSECSYTDILTDCHPMFVVPGLTRYLPDHIIHQTDPSSQTNLLQLYLCHAGPDPVSPIHKEAFHEIAGQARKDKKRSNRQG